VGGEECFLAAFNGWRNGFRNEATSCLDAPKKAFTAEAAKNAGKGMIFILFSAAFACSAVSLPKGQTIPASMGGASWLRNW
jgi:hypothetical protein